MEAHRAGSSGTGSDEAGLMEAHRAGSSGTGSDEEGLMGAHRAGSSGIRASPGQAQLSANQAHRRAQARLKLYAIYAIS